MLSRNSLTVWSLPAAALLLWASSLHAQELEISVSPSPVGSGARAAGMADAFVAIADDATAASWNPAGLIQLERPEISIVGSYNSVNEEFDAFFHDEVPSRNSADNVDLNYFSLAYPTPSLWPGRNLTFALNYQRKYDFTRRFHLKYNSAFVYGSSLLNSFQTVDFKQSGGLSTITPAFAIEITPRFSLGMALNLWRTSFLAENGWEQTLEYGDTSLVGGDLSWSLTKTKEKYEDFRGENFVFGALWNPTYKWSLALRYDTAFTGRADYEIRGATTQLSMPNPLWPLFPSAGAYLGVRPIFREEPRDVRFPATFATGTAYRFNDRLTMSLDVTRTDWSDFYVEGRSGVRRSLVDNSNLDDPWRKSHFDPTYTARFGVEHVFIPKEPEEKLPRLWTLRGGLFYDQEPASGRKPGFHLPGYHGSGKPDSFYGGALGLGLLLNQRVNLDVAYQIRLGNGVNADFIRGIKGFEEDVVQHRVLISTVIYF